MEQERVIALFGVGSIAVSVPFGLAHMYPDVVLIGIIYGVSLIAIGWYYKTPTKPPASFGEWIAVGDPVAYEDMSTRELVFKRRWLEFQYRDKNSFAYHFRHLLRPPAFEKYSEAELKDELEKCTAELQSRDNYIGL